ncbi:DNA-binding protein with MIZ/SP-RING zinc finger, PHD-finger and SAP domain-containing protein [Carex rostrata]
MDLVTSCREKLQYFRIKELKDVLTQLHLAKQGKKQDLVDRILTLVSEDPGAHRWGRRNALGKEAVAKIVDETYRKLQVHGAPDLGTRSQSSSDFTNHLIRAKEEVEAPPAPMVKVRCLCGSTHETNSMILCEDVKCKVWQHLDCVIIPEKPMEGVRPEYPEIFYCELCRLSRADPFWVTSSQPLPAYKFASSGLAHDGSNTIQSVEKTFQLSRYDRELLQGTDYDLQVWCMLINDKVQFRMHWPQHAELQVNGINVRVIPRPGQQILGINGRDDGPVITTLSREGHNKICLTRCDTRTFCFGIRIARKRTLQQVLDMVPKEAIGEPLEDALARVKRCVGGGKDSDNADSDSDLEVVAELVTVNLRCPMSGSRIKTSGRFKPCAHIACFDLEAFVELNQRSKKWQCPTCMKNYSLENIVIDPYFNRITSMMRKCGEDVCEVEVKPDGCWRVKGETEHKELTKWHSPDGSLCAVREEVEAKKPMVEKADLIKPEPTSDGHTGLKIGIKRNRNGMWEVSKHDDLANKRPSIAGNHIHGKPDNNIPRAIQMTSSGSSFRDGDDSSVNQDGGVHFDLSLNNGHEFASVALNFDPGYNLVEDRGQSRPNDKDVIVLSDSDDGNPNYEAGPSGEASVFPFSNPHPSISGRYAEDPAYGTNGGTTGLGLFSNPDEFDKFDINTLSMPGSHMSSLGYQFFGSNDNDPADPLGLAPSNGYDLTTDVSAIGDAIGDPQDFVNSHSSNPDLHGSLVANPLAFGGDDPTLQIFLPTQPSGTTSQDDASERRNMGNGLLPDDWMSLSLAAGGSHVDTTDFYIRQPQQQPTAKSSMLGGSNNDASTIHLSSNGDERHNRPDPSSDMQGPDYGFPQSHHIGPHQNDFYNIDTDSDSDGF